jgi:hypothetical protein
MKSLGQTKPKEGQKSNEKFGPNKAKRRPNEEQLGTPLKNGKG